MDAPSLVAYATTYPREKVAAPIPSFHELPPPRLSIRAIFGPMQQRENRPSCPRCNDARTDPLAGDPLAGPSCALRKDKTVKGGIKTKRLVAGWDEDYLASLLLGQST